MSAARQSQESATTHVALDRTFVIDGARYRMITTQTPTTIDTLTIELLGQAPDGEATVGSLTVHTSALGHLGALFATTFTGLAALFDSTPRAGAASEPERRRRRRGRRGTPANSGQPWTDGLNEVLRTAWEAADPAKSEAQLAEDVAKALNVTPEQLGHSPTTDVEAVLDPELVIALIAHTMKRTPLAIRSRLARLQLNPERPGPSDGQPEASHVLARTVAPTGV